MQIGRAANHGHEMRYCVNYWLIDPLRGGIDDNGQREPSIDHNIAWRDESYPFALICDDDGAPKFARLDIPCPTGEQIPENAKPLLTIVREHLLSTLRLTWREDVQFVPFTCWMFWEDDKPRKFNLELDMKGKESFNPKVASPLFIHAEPLREEVRLFVDGLDERIPAQYRYLAFYKLIEIRFKQRKKWNEQSLRESLDNFREHHRGDNPSLNLRNELHDLRDKCAHIKSKREVIGVTQLQHDELVRVGYMLPLLRELCRAFINEQAGGKFVLGDCRPWHERLVRLEGTDAKKAENVFANANRAENSFTR